MSKARDEYYNSTPEMQCKRAYQYIKQLEAEKAELYKELKRIMDADESEFLDLYFWDNTAELLQKYEGKI